MLVALPSGSAIGGYTIDERLLVDRSGGVGNRDFAFGLQAACRRLQSRQLQPRERNILLDRAQTLFERLPFQDEMVQLHLLPPDGDFMLQQGIVFNSLAQSPVGSPMAPLMIQAAAGVFGD